MSARAWQLVVVVVLTLGWCSDGAGYVLNRTRDGTPIRWVRGQCVFVQIDVSGSDDINGGRDVTAAKQAMENWRRATRHCSYLQLLPVESQGADDAGNMIHWEEESWSYDPSAMAMTTLVFVDQPGSPRDGHLLDADVALNGVGFHFSTVGEPDRADIENVLTHELGHLMGLEHPCVTEDEAAASTAVPECAVQDLSIQETTMFPLVDLGETSKRTPEDDDIRGICDLYPLEHDPGFCTQSGTMDLTGGCSVGGSAVSLPGVVLVVLVLAVAGALSRKRRSRRCLRGPAWWGSIGRPTCGASAADSRPETW